MNSKLINLIIKASIVLFLITYTNIKKNLMKGDIATIICVIIIGYFVINEISEIEEKFSIKDELENIKNEVTMNIGNIKNDIENIVHADVSATETGIHSVETDVSDVINTVEDDSHIVINKIAPSASEQENPHKDNQMKQLTPATIANDVNIQNLNNENVQSLADTVNEITVSTNGQCQIGQQIDNATGKCVAITVKTDDNNAVAVNVIPTTPDLNLDVTDNTDGKLTAQETVDLLEEDAKKKQIKCEEMGMIIDEETGECIGLTSKTGEYTNVKRSPQVKDKEVTYTVVCSNNDISKCKWKKVGKLVPKRSMAQYGYSFVRPHEWDVPRKRTPVCNPQKDCPICPLYINKDTEDLLTVQNIHTEIPPSKIGETF